MQVADAKKIEKIVVLGTGGTIAGQARLAHDHVGYVAGELSVQAVLASVDGVADILGPVALISEQVAQLDSKDMDAVTWHALALRVRHWAAQPGVGAVLITHGTDTLEETAWFLAQTCRVDCPVVLVSAMRPASAFSPDGPQNLRDALVVALDAGSRGVLAVSAGAVHAARHVRKVHPYRIDAFSSGEAGVLGWVESGRVRWQHAAGPCTGLRQELPAPDQWPWVEVLTGHAMAQASSVNALLAAGVRGLVVAATGNGTVHAQWEQALFQAQKKGVRVWITTRCEQGQVVVRPGAETCPWGEFTDLPPLKARISLMLALMP